MQFVLLFDDFDPKGNLTSKKLNLRKIKPIILWFAWPVKWWKKICMKAKKF